VLTTPACPLREFIVQDCQQAVKKLPGVTDVLVDVTAETPQQKGLPDRGIAGVKIFWQFPVAKAVWAKVPLLSICLLLLKQGQKSGY